MGSLDDLKILDFSTLLPGPYATLMLADMGAEVLKISSASRPDIVLDYPPFIGDTGVSASQAWLGRNKKTMFLNLKTGEGKAVVKELVKEYDIVLEQFRPGVMEKLGLGYEDLKAVNPKLIYCSLTGYGQTGPLRDAAGHDINYMSRSGIISQAGRRESGPSLMNFQIADIAVGSMNSVIGILAAVNYRKNTGKGQYIDVAMMDGCVPFNSLDGAGFLVSGKEPKREGERLNGGCIYDFYETKDGEYVITDAMKAELSEFFGAFGSEEETAVKIKEVYDKEGYVMDTHTAVAAVAYDKYKAATGDDKTPTVIASTASPYKFTRSVMDAIDPAYDAEDDFELVDELNKVSKTAIPKAIEEIRTAPVLHDTVCETAAMEDEVKKILGI